MTLLSSTSNYLFLKWRRDTALAHYDKQSASFTHCRNTCNWSNWNRNRILYKTEMFMVWSMFGVCLGTFYWHVKCGIRLDYIRLGDFCKQKMSDEVIQRRKLCFKRNTYKFLISLTWSIFTPGLDRTLMIESEESWDEILFPRHSDRKIFPTKCVCSCSFVTRNSEAVFSPCFFLLCLIFNIFRSSSSLIFLSFLSFSFHYFFPHQVIVRHCLWSELQPYLIAFEPRAFLLD